MNGLGQVSVPADLSSERSLPQFLGVKPHRYTARKPLWSTKNLARPIYDGVYEKDEPGYNWEGVFGSKI